MATALQCPACGFKHRLDAVAGSPVFPCSQCSRQLKLPEQYRNGGTASSAPSAPRDSGATARRSGATAGAPRGSARAGAGARARSTAGRPAGPPTIRLPLRILAWVIAFVLGAFVVRQLAKWTGFVGGDTFVDLMIGGDFSIYLRLALLVPVWALFATLFATGFLEAPGWWYRRGVAAGAPAANASADRPVPPSRARTKPSPAPPEDRERLDPLPPPRRVVPRAAPAPVASEVAVPPVGQRPRRIPRRDTGS